MAPPSAWIRRPNLSACASTGPDWQRRVPKRVAKRNFRTGVTASLHGRFLLNEDSRVESPNRGKTSNVQPRTSNAAVSEDSPCHSMFGVGCSMLDVSPVHGEGEEHANPRRNPLSLS